MNKIIATLVALSAVSVFAAEPAKAPATPASAPAKVEKKAEVKPTKSKSVPAKKNASKADAKPATPAAK
jgi:hypothetical protein